MNNRIENQNFANQVLVCNNLRKSFSQGDSELKILNGISFEIQHSQAISIVGSSGSGKSTLLHVLAGLEKATSGDIVIDGSLLNNLNDKEVCQIRNRKLGFIYQFHHLLPEFTALENTLMPLMINGKVTKSDKDFALNLLDRLSLNKRLEHYPAQLSGGERQRVAIARAVINNPKLIFADEPTGNLDNHTGSQVLEVFFELQRELKTSLIIVTHDVAIASMTDLCYRLHDGKIRLN